MLTALAHFIYDERFIPFNRQNAANYVTILGAWLARLSFYLFGIVLIAFATEGLLTEWMIILRYTAIGFGILAGICDALDGFIARKLGCVTELGKILDPHHDKTQYLAKTGSLIADAAIAAGVSGTYWYLVGALILKYSVNERDETVMFHRLWAKSVVPNADMSAGTSGKARTVFCFVGMPLMHLCISPLDVLPVYLGISCLLTGMTLLSLRIYVRNYRNLILKQRGQLS